MLNSTQERNISQEDWEISVAEMLLDEKRKYATEDEISLFQLNINSTFQNNEFIYHKLAKIVEDYGVVVFPGCKPAQARDIYDNVESIGPKYSGILGGHLQADGEKFLTMPGAATAVERAKKVLQMYTYELEYKRQYGTPPELQKLSEVQKMDSPFQLQCASDQFVVKNAALVKKTTGDLIPQPPHADGVSHACFGALLILSDEYNPTMFACPPFPSVNPFVTWPALDTRTNTIAALEFQRKFEMNFRPLVEMDPDMLRRRVVPVSPDYLCNGDMILFRQDAVHAGNSNPTDTDRLSLYFTIQPKYYDTDPETEGSKETQIHPGLAAEWIFGYDDPRTSNLYLHYHSHPIFRSVNLWNHTGPKLRNRMLEWFAENDPQFFNDMLRDAEDIEGTPIY